MNTNQHRRIVPILVTTALAVALGALPASAGQDKGPATGPSNYPYFNSIQRVGTQFVALDYLTGKGVRAPAGGVVR